MDNMTVTFLACYFLMMGFILLYFFVKFKDYKKYSRGINNIIYSKDRLRVTYAYSIPHAKERVVEILRLKNAQDRLPYEFDEKAMEIGFKDSQGEFQHRVLLIDTGCILNPKRTPACCIWSKLIFLFRELMYQCL